MKIVLKNCYEIETFLLQIWIKVFILYVRTLSVSVTTQYIGMDHQSIKFERSYYEKLHQNP